MKRGILEGYVLKQVARSACFALLVFMAVFLLGTAFRHLRNNVSVSQILKVAPYVLPYTLPYTLPIALLMGTTLALGRLVADHEVLAVRASGISPLRLGRPIFLLGILCSAGALALQAEVIPYSHQRTKAMQEEFVEDLLTLAKGRAKRIQDDKQGFELYCERFEGARLEGVVIRRQERRPSKDGVLDQQGTLLFVAPRATLTREGSFLLFHLEDATATFIGKGGQTTPEEVPRLLRVHLDHGFVPLEIPKQRDKVSFLASQALERERVTMEAQLRETDNPKVKKKLRKNLRRIAVEEHGRPALALASLMFVLLGFPLPILMRQENRLVPFFAGFVLAGAVYFLPFLVGRNLAEDGALPAPIALWGCVVLSGIAAAVLWIWLLRR